MMEMADKSEVHDLSLLSMLAAHELERLQRSEPADGMYLAELRNRLEEHISVKAPNDIRNIAPSTVNMYRHAVHAATNIDPQDFPDLVTAISSLLEQLGQASELAPEPTADVDLEPLIAFVVDLHGQLLAQKQRSHTARRTSRYRV